MNMMMIVTPVSLMVTLVVRHSIPLLFNSKNVQTSIFQVSKVIKMKMMMRMKTETMKIKMTIKITLKMNTKRQIKINVKSSIKIKIAM